MRLNHYSLMADLFGYPDLSFLGKVRELVGFLKEHYFNAAREAQLFYEGISQCDLDLSREIFTRTFDVQAITTLDIGYVLFGDDYKRGEILSNLNREHKNADNDCGLELADHLPNLLRLMPKLKDSEFVQELISELLAPALQIMIREFESLELNKKKQLYQKHYKTWIEMSSSCSTVYCHALKALLFTLKQDFQIDEAKTDMYLNHKHDFFSVLDPEMSIEKLAKE